MNHITTKQITTLGIMIAIVTVSTYFGITWPFSFAGYTHLGTLAAMVIALRYGKYAGAISGGIGMALFDIFSQWTAWAPGTFVIRTITGFLAGWIAYDPKTETQGGSLQRNIIALVLAMVLMLIGSYLFEAIFFTDFKVALLSITGNTLQFVLGAGALYLVPKLIEYDKAMNQ